MVGVALPLASGAETAGPPGSVAAAELKQAERLAALCSASNVSGTGLRGEYFASAKVQGAPLLVRVDATVDFDKLLEWPATDHKRPRSAQWTGWVKAPITGLYRFHATQPRTSIEVARQSMLGKEQQEGDRIELTAGRFYPITLQAEQLELMTGRLALEWTTPFGARYVVPRALLYLPVGA